MPSDEMGLKCINGALQFINENQKQKAILVTILGNEKENNNYHRFRKIEDSTYYQDLTEGAKKLFLISELFLYANPPNCILIQNRWNYRRRMTSLNMMNFWWKESSICQLLLIASFSNNIYAEDEASSGSQLFFIFDGFDENHENYQRVIIKAMSYLKMKPNDKFIGISTRPQQQERLEEELQSVTFMRRPFDHENKITFWKSFGCPMD